MTNSIRSIALAAGILLTLLPSLARSEIIQLDCFGGATEDDVTLIYKILKDHDTQALAQMVISGKAAVFSKGETVSVIGHGGFLSSLDRVRKRGEIESFYLPYEWVKDSAPPEDGPKPSSSNETNAGAAPTPDSSLPAEPAPIPKPTPVPATALSIPKGFNGEITGIKLFLNQEPASWIKYYGNTGHQNPAGPNYLWYVGRFQLRVGFDRKSHKGDSVNLSAQPCQPVLTLAEAKKLMASLGLKTFSPNLSRPNSGTWGHPDDPICARYQGDESDDHVLVIETALLYNNEGFVGE